MYVSAGAQFGAYWLTHGRAVDARSMKGVSVDQSAMPSGTIPMGLTRGTASPAAAATAGRSGREQSLPV